MQTKEELLQAVQTAVAQGLITRQDIDTVLGGAAAQPSVTKNAATNEVRRLSVVTAMFHIAGVILFAAVWSVIAQTWSDGAALHILLTVVFGITIWAVAYALRKGEQSSEIKEGLIDALILTGSLLLIAGGYIVTNLFGGYSSVDFFEAIPALVVLSALHAGFYYLVRRDLLFLLSILLGVSVVGAFVFGILRDASVSGNIWSFSIIILFGLLVWATHVLAGLAGKTNHLRTAYDKVAIVASLIVAYIASFGDLAPLWYLLLATGIFGVFYLSIISREKVLLGTASAFLVLIIITVSFRYFMAFGVTASLILSAAGLLGAAALASNLSKKYLS